MVLVAQSVERGAHVFETHTDPISLFIWIIFYF